MWLVSFLSSEVWWASSLTHTFKTFILVLSIKSGQDRIGVWAALALLGTGHIKAAMIPWQLLACSLLAVAQKCVWVQGWCGTPVVDDGAFSLLALHFLCFEKEKVVSSHVCSELKIRSWCVRDSMTTNPTLVCFPQHQTALRHLWITW